MARYSRKIKWQPVPIQSKILQIYAKGLEYALVSDNYEQCHEFVWCKDFLHDVYYSTINNKEFNLYKFSYCPQHMPKPCLKEARILLTNGKDKNFSSKIPAVCEFINQIEDELGIKKTTARICSNPPSGYTKAGVFIFKGDRRWIVAPSMLSLYALLLRIGFVHKRGTSYKETLEALKKRKLMPYQSKDVYWFKCSEMAFDEILEKSDKYLFSRNFNDNYPKNLSMDSIHNKLGIIAFSNHLRSIKSGKIGKYPFK
jgi:hypothetical protein